MQCASCGSENPEGAKFCIECAAPLRKRCPSCGAENLPRAKFCAECAAPLTRQSRVQGLESRVPSTQHLPPNTQAEAEAEVCFLKAIEIAQRQQAKSLELRAVMSLSRLWQQQGKKDEARQMLAETYGWFTEGFDTADLQEARVLLEELT